MLPGTPTVSWSRGGRVSTVFWRDVEAQAVKRPLSATTNESERKVFMRPNVALHGQKFMGCTHALRCRTLPGSRSDFSSVAGSDAGRWRPHENPHAISGVLPYRGPSLTSQYDQRRRTD